MWTDKSGKMRSGGVVGIAFLALWVLVVGWITLSILGAEFAENWSRLPKWGLGAGGLLVACLGCLPTRWVMNNFEVWYKDHNLN